MADLTATETAKRQILGYNPVTQKEFEAAIPRIGLRSRYLLERAVNIQRDKQIEHMKELTHMFETVALQKPFILGVMEGILKGIFIQTWTAIEAFCGDILNECIPKHSNCFHPNHVKPYFTSRTTQLKEHFEKAFQDDPRINGLIHDKYIAAVAAFRHCLIHKQGRVEKMFRDDALLAAPLLDSLAALSDHNQIRFTGTMVFDIIDPALAKVYDLAQAVDDWIDLHKPAPPP